MMGYMRTRPPSHAITKQGRARCQSKERAPQLTPTDPSQTVCPDSRALPLGQNKTVRPRDRARSRTLRQKPPNREALSDRPAPLTVPQRATDHPEHTIERGNHDSQTSPETNDARVDDEPLHHEAHDARTTVTTTREPTLRAHTARVIERAGKQNTVAETHFRSDLSSFFKGGGLSAFVTPSHTTSIPFSSSAPPISSIFS